MEAIKKHEEKILAVVFFYLLITSFVNQRVYAFFGRIASLVVFFGVALMLLPRLKEILSGNRLKAAAVVLTGIISMLNLLLIHSDKGAVLIPSDLALICLTSDYVRPGRKCTKILAAGGGILTILWYPAVRWSYNFNMAGLTFMLFMIMSVLFLELLKKEHDPGYYRPLQLLMYVTAFFYATLYHSRCAMMGILAFGIVLGCLKLVRDSGLFLKLLWLVLTLGSIAFTGIYVLASQNGVNPRFLYKEVLSGRQDIWEELWEAFFRQPLTGIGSSYTLKSFEIFEVHNGLFDILTVHGMIVFALVVFLLLSALFPLRSGKDSVSDIAIAAAAAMLTASFFENFFIVPPYSMFFFIFLILGRSQDLMP